MFELRQWQLPSGSHVLIEGESGRGKTTLLHLLAGLMRPQAGTIRWDDYSFTDKSEAELTTFRRNRVGLVFQRLNLLEHLSLAENVQLGLRSGSAANQIPAALERVGLAGREKDLCSYLSQGEQQRVAVARVLAAKPDTILADEPTSSLDQKNGLFVMQALQEAARGKTLIVVSHDPRLKSLFSNRLQFEELIR